MALEVPKVNFLQQAMQAQQAQQARTVQPTKAVGPSFGQATGGGAESNNPFGSQLFAGETSGLNSMKPGDVISTPPQAGKPAGVSKLLYNA